MVAWWVAAEKLSATGPTRGAGDAGCLPPTQTRPPTTASLPKMKTLLILRHAKSSWSSSAVSDFDRPLNGRGRRDAPRMGAFMAENDLVPDLILCSAARRARDTARAVATASGADEPPVELDSLYEAEPESYLQEISERAGDAEVVMVVGHNPTLEELLSDLTGSQERMPTAALARIELPIDSWGALDGDVEGELAALWYPRELD